MSNAKNEEILWCKLWNKIKQRSWSVVANSNRVHNVHAHIWTNVDNRIDSWLMRHIRSEVKETIRDRRYAELQLEAAYQALEQI
jgi:hypothetical protein